MLIFLCNLLLVKYKKLLYNKNDCEQKEQKGKYMKGLYDIHTHIIPHVDDGADTIEITKKILQMEYNDGVRTIFATSHFRRRMFEAPMEKIRQQYLQVQQLSLIHI